MLHTHFFVFNDFNVDYRPPFSVIETWLATLCIFATNSIMNNGSTEVKHYIVNNNIDLKVVNDEINIENKSIEVDGNNFEDADNVLGESALLNEKPKSLYFSRDFSETGERLRNSFRARRHKKSIQNKKLVQENADDNILLCDTSESEPLSLIEITNEAKQSLANVEHTLNKVSQKLKNDQRLNQFDNDAFVIKMGDGVFSIKGVKKLENLSDIDSSCDTSLNFIESSLSGDNNNLNSQSLEYNSDNSLVAKNEDIPVKSKLLLQNKEKNLYMKEFDQSTTSPKNTFNKRSIPENRIINSNRCLLREKKINENKLNILKKYSPKSQVDATKPVVVQNTKSANNKEQSNKRSNCKQTGTPLTLNLISKSLSHPSEKLTISEKMTESARAKIKAKIPINKTFKNTMVLTNPININEKNKLKTVTLKSTKNLKKSSCERNN